MIYVIGEATGSGQGYSSSHRMADMLGVSREEFLREVVWINMFDQPFSDPSKLVGVVERAANPQSDAIILLGRKVATAWHMEDMKPLAFIKRHGGMGVSVLILPHPSGLNRWWNKRDNAELARIELNAVWSQFR